MKLSREQVKLLHLLMDKVSYQGPSTTGFSIQTFKALEKRGYLQRGGPRIFTITESGLDIAKRLPRYA